MFNFRLVLGYGRGAIFRGDATPPTVHSLADPSKTGKAHFSKVGLQDRPTLRGGGSPHGAVLYLRAVYPLLIRTLIESAGAGMFVLDGGRRLVIPRTELTYPGHTLRMHQNAANAPVDHVMADF